MKQMNSILIKSNYFNCFLKEIKTSPLFLCLLVPHERKSRNEAGYWKNGVALLLRLLLLVEV